MTFTFPIFDFLCDETLGVRETKPEDWQVTGDNQNIESRAKPQIIHLFFTYFSAHN